MIKYRIAIVCGLIVAAFLENGLRQGVLFHHNTGGKWDTGNWELTGSGSTRGIADERWTYYSGNFFMIDDEPRAPLEVYSEAGKYLAPFFQGLPITVAIPGGADMKAYFGDFANCIDEYGLTDSSIAHITVGNRSRIGHEKKATDTYLYSRHTAFELGAVVAQLPTPLPQSTLAFYIPSVGYWQLARMICYDQSTMSELVRRFRSAQSQAVIPQYETLVPYYVQHILPTRPLDQLEQDYAGYQDLYFRRYPDSALERPFVDRIAELKRDSAAQVPK